MLVGPPLKDKPKIKNFDRGNPILNNWTSLLHIIIGTLLISFYCEWKAWAPHLIKQTITKFENSKKKYFVLSGSESRFRRVLYPWNIVFAKYSNPWKLEMPNCRQFRKNRLIKFKIPRGVDDNHGTFDHWFSSKILFGRGFHSNVLWFHRVL